MSRHPLSKEELLLDYSKYWFWTQPEKNPLSQELLRYQIDPSDVLPITELNRLLDPGYMAREQGWCILPDGTGYHAVYIWMPNVSIDMIDWWYVWHFNAPPSVPEEYGNLRYKIWCPQEHVDTGFDDEESRRRALDESIPMRERRYGSKNFIHESIDGGNGDNIIHMHAECYNPVDFGFDPVRVNQAASGTIIAARTPTMKQVQIYQYRPYGQHDVELRLRVYSGWDFVDGKFVKVPGYQAEPEGLINGSQHVLCEYPNLARFLPKLYEEEGFKPIDAY